MEVKIGDRIDDAAQEIFDATGGDGDFGVVASIIYTHAAPLLTLLAESKREHDGTMEGCPKLWSNDATCDCGADAWNARVEAVLNGQNPQNP